MTEPSHDSDRDLDEDYVDRNGDDYIREQTGFTETLLLEGNRSEVSKKLPYLLVLTCGGAG